MEVVLNSEGLQVINLLVAFLLPMLVALVTSRFANGATKSVTLIVLTVVLATFTEWRDDGGFVVFDAFILFVQNLIVAISGYYGVLKPSRLAGTNSVIALKAPGGLNVGPEKSASPDRTLRE
jgi:hypothetical protein